MKAFVAWLLKIESNRSQNKNVDSLVMYLCIGMIRSNM